MLFVKSVIMLFLFYMAFVLHCFYLMINATVTLDVIWLRLLRWNHHVSLFELFMLDLKRTHLKGRRTKRRASKGFECLQMMRRAVKAQGVQEAPSIGVFAKVNAIQVQAWFKPVSHPFLLLLLLVFLRFCLCLAVCFVNCIFTMKCANALAFLLNSLFIIHIFF